MYQASSSASGARIDGSEGPYMLTLCPLASPVSVRFPESSPLRQFKFFMSRASDSNTAEPLRLHMGYFESLAEAERWAAALRPRYPAATATRVPQTLLQHPNSGVPVLRAASKELPASAAVRSPPPTPAESKPLTDTQVLRILDGRRESPAAAQEPHAGISLVSPDDTTVRRALKEAVAEGAPVSFAVQLLWAATDIDLAKVPSLSIFRAYTLYKVETRREGRSWYCLRLGFFTDAISAKQVAYYVRSHFVSVAVVPVTESELTQSADGRIDPAALSDDFQRNIDEALAADRSRPSPPQASSARVSADTKAKPPARPQSKKTAKDSLEQTLEMLAVDEMWNDPESHTETGVRHLKFEVRKSSTR